MVDFKLIQPQPGEFTGIFPDHFCNNTELHPKSHPRQIDFCKSVIIFCVHRFVGIPVGNLPTRDTQLPNFRALQTGTVRSFFDGKSKGPNPPNATMPPPTPQKENRALIAGLIRGWWWLMHLIRPLIGGNVALGVDFHDCCCSDFWLQFCPQRQASICITARLALWRQISVASVVPWEKGL